MKPLILIVAIAVIFASTSIMSADYPETQVTLRVLDEQNKPVSAADVGIGFKVASTTHFGNEEVAVRGLSNAAGEFTGSAKADRFFGYTVTKSGYYATIGSYSFKEAVSGKWQPWKPVIDVPLKKVVNPIAMYARKQQLVMPVVGEPVGFDLVAGDFVGSHGKGRTSDFVFLLTRDWKSRNEFDVRLTVTFTNQGDGIQVVRAPLTYGSSLKLPRVAPEGGYQAQFLTSISRLPGKAIREEAAEDRSFLFRIRTVLDTEGKVISAQHGKIQGDISIDPINSSTASISFTYYVNPTPNDRNLEFNPDRNLFRNLSDDEVVEQP